MIILTIFTLYLGRFLLKFFSTSLVRSEYSLLCIVLQGEKAVGFTNEIFGSVD
ncbi:MAG: hypothetical protein PHY66_01230 [Aliarcobacter sp.]|nr:hypothetical protein [Aliarcobacter sp.]